MYSTNTEARMKMNMLLRILEDMHPYSVAGIASLLKIPEDKAALFLRFLAKYNIVTYDEEHDAAVISTDFLLLM
jgi:DNA-binding IclR family transcriptional regulator